jgi:hypothetical protein
MKSIIYSTQSKTFSVVSPELAQAMLACGNPHGYNRACDFPASSLQHMKNVFAANGYTDETPNK